MVSASDLGLKGREFEPWPVHPRCVLRQNTLTLTVPLSSQVYKWEPANIALGKTLQNAGR